MWKHTQRRSEQRRDGVSEGFGVLCGVVRVHTHHTAGCGGMCLGTRSFTGDEENIMTKV